jgi:N-dimethylarginine dimethylaminohydrolase
MRPSPRILMCPPDHYGIEYEINPWMSRSMVSVRDEAFKQWLSLRTLLSDLAVQIEELLAQPGLPDLVFTANAGLIFRNRFYSSRFKHPQRAGESPFFEAWFQEHGFEVIILPDGMYHEGAGDALFCGDSLFAGYRTRSDALAHQWVASQIGKRVLPVELVNPRFYHLDTCFCPIASNRAIWFPGAFDDYGRKVIESNVPNLIAVPEAEAHRFGCNAVVVGRTVVHNSGCPELRQLLRDVGYQSIETPLDEFLKAGGSSKCLTFRVDGEDAATW